MNRKIRPVRQARSRPAPRAPDEAHEEPPAPEPSLDAEIKPRPPELPPEERPNEEAAANDDAPKSYETTIGKPRVRTLRR